MFNFYFIIYQFLIIINIFLVFLGFKIISNKNPIYAIIYLAITYLVILSLFIILNIKFISLLFLIIYLGALIVLFLFVVMMLNIQIIQINEQFIKYWPLSFLFFIYILFILIYSLHNDYFYYYYYNIYLKDNIFNFFYYLNIIEYNNLINFKLNYNTNLISINEIQYSDYSFIFLIGGLILLSGMYGAIVISLNNIFNKKILIKKFENNLMIKNINFHKCINFKK